MYLTDVLLIVVIGLMAGFMIMGFIYYWLLNKHVTGDHRGLVKLIKEFNTNLLLLIKLDMEIAKAVLPGEGSQGEGSQEETKKKTKKKGTMIKGSQEAKDRMAKIRAAKAKKQVKAVV